MFGFGGSVKIYYCPTPVNLRKSFDGLAGAVEEYIKRICPVSPMVKENIGDRVLKRLEQEKVMPSGV